MPAIRRSTEWPGAFREREYFELNFGDKFVESASGWGADEFVQDGYAYTVAAVIFVPASRVRYQCMLTVGTGLPTRASGSQRPIEAHIFIDPSSAAGSVNQYSGTGVTITGGSWNFVAIAAWM
ncbi:MAG: hypothetical protein HPM95_12995 [Alphaproteobacteria bacterium]|nr:hypothetical protein [Alphaproteobacteria bacterium]